LDHHNKKLNSSLHSNLIDYYDGSLTNHHNKKLNSSLHSNLIDYYDGSLTNHHNKKLKFLQLDGSIKFCLFILKLIKVRNTKMPRTKYDRQALERSREHARCLKETSRSSLDESFDEPLDESISEPLSIAEQISNAFDEIDKQYGSIDVRCGRLAVITRDAHIDVLTPDIISSSNLTSDHPSIPHSCVRCGNEIDSPHTTFMSDHQHPNAPLHACHVVDDFVCGCGMCCGCYERLDHPENKHYQDAHVGFLCCNCMGCTCDDRVFEYCLICTMFGTKCPLCKNVNECRRSTCFSAYCDPFTCEHCHQFIDLKTMPMPV
jgi:hypothetical protein